MSNCKTLFPLVTQCKNLSGGIARVWFGDGEDFSFTQAAEVDGLAQKYTAIVPRTVAGATGTPKLIPIKFEKEEAEYTFKHSRKGNSVKYEHQLEFKQVDISHEMALWNAAVDSAGACCGLLVIIQLNSGRVLVAGEKYVNAGVIDIPLDLRQDGSSGTSGKAYDDMNGETVIVKGSHNRKLYEYEGGLQSLIDLQ